MTKQKRFGKLLRSWFIGVVTAAIFVQPVAAVTPTTITVGQTPPPSQSPALIVTSLIGSVVPDYIELYNQSDAPLFLGGWNVDITTHDTTLNGCGDLTHPVALPPAWLLSKKYLTLERNAVPDQPSTALSFAFDTTSELSLCISPELQSITLVREPDPPEQVVTVNPTNSFWSSITASAAQHKQRGNSPSSTRAITGDFVSDYKNVLNTTISLNSDPLYLSPVDDGGLQVLEILPNARACSPAEIDPTCNDYVKLYNPTSQPINLALYRVRIGSKGQSESITNTLTWGKGIDPLQDELVLPPGQYFMLTTRNDNQPLSITDSGDYVWLEDAYGTKTYDPIVQYPDASSVTKVGWAWAFDGTTWRWTSTPKPGAPNYFPPEVAPPSNPATPIILTPCASNQYRNPATNRCKSIVVASGTLSLCGAGQERNPATNRCRSVVTASATLAPCQPGWERNPETNRCRKAVTAVAGATAMAVKDVATPSVDTTGWFIALLVVALATAYGIYEWRQDLRLAYRKAAEGILRMVKRNSN